MQPLTRYINDTAIDRIHEFMTVSLPFAGCWSSITSEARWSRALPPKDRTDKGMQTAYLQPSTDLQNTGLYMSPRRDGKTESAGGSSQ